MLEKEKIKSLAVLLPVTQPIIVVTCRLERAARLGCQGEPAGSAGCESCSGVGEAERAAQVFVRSRGCPGEPSPACRSEAGVQLSPRGSAPALLPPGVRSPVPVLPLAGLPCQPSFGRGHSVPNDGGGASRAGEKPKQIGKVSSATYLNKLFIGYV